MFFFRPFVIISVEGKKKKKNIYSVESMKTDVMMNLLESNRTNTRKKKRKKNNIRKRKTI